MSRYRIQTFRKIRKELDRYPNIGVVEPLSLGDIGFYNGRKAKFDWHSNMKNFKLSISPQKFNDPIHTADELYTSSNAVNYEFVLDEQNLGTAQFNLNKSYSLVSQAVDLTTERYEISELEKLLLEKIRSKEIKWNPKWVIITQVYKSPSFSLIVSGGKDGYAAIKTNTKLNQRFFNIADSSLNLTLSKSKQIAYNIIGKQNITPFFRIHKLKKNWKTNDLKLVSY